MLYTLENIGIDTLKMCRQYLFLFAKMSKNSNIGIIWGKLWVCWLIFIVSSISSSQNKVLPQFNDYFFMKKIKMYPVNWTHKLF